MRRHRSSRRPSRRSPLGWRRGGLALLLLGAPTLIAAQRSGAVAVVALAVAVLVVLGVVVRWRVRSLRSPSDRRRWPRGAVTDYQTLTPEEFERYVGGVLARLGYRQVTRVGGPGDRGVDLRARTRAGQLVIVQCKRYAPWHPVREPDIRLFLGACTAERAGEAIFVTASTFNTEAVALARNNRIWLINGADLRRLAMTTR